MLTIFHQLLPPAPRSGSCPVLPGQGHVDEAGRVVDPVHVGEVARQFEAGTAGGAADVERPLMAAAQLAGKAGQGLGVVGDPEVGRPILEVEILSDQRVGLVGIDDDRLLIAETR